jgi:hypothetical protein
VPIQGLFPHKDSPHALSLRNPQTQSRPALITAPRDRTSSPSVFRSPLLARVGVARRPSSEQGWGDGRRWVEHARAAVSGRAVRRFGRLPSTRLSSCHPDEGRIPRRSRSLPSIQDAFSSGWRGCAGSTRRDRRCGAGRSLSRGVYPSSCTDAKRGTVCRDDMVGVLRCAGRNETDTDRLRGYLASKSGHWMEDRLYAEA